MNYPFAPPPPDPERRPTDPEQVLIEYVDPVVKWRAEQLEAAGMEPLHAAAVAVRTDVDLHKALAMCQAGCPSHLVGAVLL